MSTTRKASAPRSIPPKPQPSGSVKQPKPVVKATAKPVAKPKPAAKAAPKPAPKVAVKPPPPASGSTKPNSTASDSTRRCLFTPIRGPHKPCDNTNINEWGYCSKHKSTNQSKEARAKYEIAMEEQRQLQLKELDEELGNLSSDDEIERLIIKPNRWGRFEEPNTGIVFDPDTNLAKGVQGADGKLLDLDEEAIKNCIEHGWDYLVKPPKTKRRPEPKQVAEDQIDEDEVEEEVELEADDESIAEGEVEEELETEDTAEEVVEDELTKDDEEEVDEDEEEDD